MFHRILHVATFASVTLLAWLSWTQSYTFAHLDPEQQAKIFGGAACNHRNSKLDCGAGLTNCGGDCIWDDRGQRCTFYPGHELQASSGTIYICADATGQINCDTQIPGPQSQSCTLTKDCVCRDKGFPYIQQAECRQEDSTATVTYYVVTVTTDCQNE